MRPYPQVLAPIPPPPRLHARRRLTIFVIGVATYGLAWVIQRTPSVVESVYARVIGPLITQPLSVITGLVPFSLAECVYLGYASYLLWMMVRGVRQARAGRRSWLHAGQGGLLRLARDAGVVLVLFYVLWGFNYSRPPLETRAGWPKWDGVDADELAALTEQLVLASNEAYVALHGVEDTGEPTELPEDLDTLRLALRDGWSNVVGLMGLPSHMDGRYGRVKWLVSTPVFARFGITGFYFPFTAEANVRYDLPALSLPHAMAHEQAHQRGIGEEAEANFFGFMVGSVSPDPHLRYSALVSGLLRMAQALVQTDRERWVEIAPKMYAGVRRDQEHQAEFFRQFIGVGTTVGRAVNDRYLRANRVQGGVRNYGHSVRLMIAFARRNAGQVVP